MRAFIVRPFGTQENVDFDRVQAELIAPALKAVNVDGDTTQEIARAGNIREDMFKLLATADLVIADISIHNANVFYELGVRHALRGKRTFLLRAKLDKKTPFDLQTDRYLEYSHTEPAKALPALIEALRQTLDADDIIDSPVLALLQIDQGIIPSDLARLLEPPADFHEEVFRAEKADRKGDLGLLSEETQFLAWQREGLRRVGEAQFHVASWEPARITWERVRNYEPEDVAANSRLATVFQKLKDLTNSDIAVARVLKDPKVRGPQRAELSALRASNIKTRWSDDWSGLAESGERERAALKSPLAAQSYDAYFTAFASDRNHFYSGLNALAMLTIMLELGQRYPDIWVPTYETDDDGEGVVRGRYERSRKQLLAGAELALSGAKWTAELEGKPDPWLEITKADLTFLRESKPERVAAAYDKALTGCQRFHFGAARRQLELFQRLGVRRESSAAALEVIDKGAAKLPAERGGPSGPGRVLLFTGHRLDAPGRKTPRFPAAAEAAARKLIADAIDREHRESEGAIIGLAGGASGADILFHELCADRGIPTEMFIVSSREAFVKESVQDAGPNWVARFDSLAKKLPVKVLGNSNDGLQLPRWLRPAKNYSIWERNNRWILHNALVYGAAKVTLIALWNGEVGDGPGGTKDMVAAARDRGAKVVVLDAKPLAAKK